MLPCMDRTLLELEIHTGFGLQGYDTVSTY